MIFEAQGVGLLMIVGAVKVRRGQRGGGFAMRRRGSALPRLAGEQA
jgi:hypothetical protein